MKAVLWHYYIWAIAAVLALVLVFIIIRTMKKPLPKLELELEEYVNKETKEGEKYLKEKKISEAIEEYQAMKMRYESEKELLDEKEKKKIYKRILGFYKKIIKLEKKFESNHNVPKA